MRKGIEVRLGPGDRERLEAVIGSGNSPQKHVWRSRIVLLSAEGVGTMAIQRQTGKGKPTIWRWQARFMAEGVDGLLHEATRPAGKPPLSAEVIERVVEMTLAEPLGEATHWTCRAAVNVIRASLQSGSPFMIERRRSDRGSFQMPRRPQATHDADRLFASHRPAHGRSSTRPALPERPHSPTLSRSYVASYESSSQGPQSCRFCGEIHWPYCSPSCSSCHHKRAASGTAAHRAGWLHTA